MIRQILLLVLVSGIGVFTMSCETSDKLSLTNPEYYVNDTVNLSLHDTATFAKENISLIWKEVEDSRCPKGAYCLHAGYAYLTFDGIFKDAATTFEMTFAGNARIINGYSLKITDVSPYPEVGKDPGQAKSCRLILGKPVGLVAGTVKDYTGLDACGFIIELESGIKLEPAVVDPDFTFKDNQRVMLKYTELKDRASACMVGTIAQITEIYEIVE
ncbi:MAG TPA: hypothetical protein VHO72_16505 [Bacteroidales bacterium]|nr:hypothetical protein [Bacteroidales bacterium]